MAILRRKPSAKPLEVTPSILAPEPPEPATPRPALKRRELGKRPVIVIPIVDKTDYREVVKRYKDKVRNPKTAIRAKCVECSGGSLKEVQLCPVETCALHPFRMGLNPFNKKTQARLSRESGELFEGDDPDETHDGDEDEDHDE